MKENIFVSEKCIGCGLCVEDCTRRAITLENGKIIIDSAKCNDCYHCFAICPTGAVEIPGLNQNEVIEIEKEKLSVSPDDMLYLQKTRRSIRKYKDQKIPKEILDKILESGRYAPTGGNMQTNHFIVISDGINEIREKVINTLYETTKDEEKLERLNLKKYKFTWENMYRKYYETGEDRLFFKAPTVILITNDDNTGNGEINGGIAASRMELLANTYGLGICYIGFLKRALMFEPSLKELVGVREGENPSLAFVIGYPDVEYQRTVFRNELDVRYI